MTDDAEGEVVTAAGAAGVTDADIEAAMAKLRGGILQVPSAVSAIKVERCAIICPRSSGRTDVDLPARPVQVDRFTPVASRASEVGGVACPRPRCRSGVLDRHLCPGTGARSRGCAGRWRASHGVAAYPRRVFRIDEAQTLDEAEQRLQVSAAGPRGSATASRR